MFVAAMQRFVLRIRSSARLRSSIVGSRCIPRTIVPVSSWNGCNGGRSSNTDRPFGSTRGSISNGRPRAKPALRSSRALSRSAGMNRYWRGIRGDYIFHGEPGIGRALPGSRRAGGLSLQDDMFFAVSIVIRRSSPPPQGFWSPLLFRSPMSVFAAKPPDYGAFGGERGTIV